MVNRLVMFLRTDTMPTVSSCSGRKLVHSMPTKMQLAGNQTRAMSQLHGCAARGTASQAASSSESETFTAQSRSDNFIGVRSCPRVSRRTAFKCQVLDDNEVLMPWVQHTGTIANQAESWLMPAKSNSYPGSNPTSACAPATKD